jgi:WD domain, G-beta repeat
VLTGHTSLVGLLGLSNSYLVSAAADSTLRVWDPSTGDLLHTLAAHTGAITCFQHDEFKILSGSDGTLKMWDIRDGTNGRDLLTGITGVWQVVFDGRWCVAASNRHDATFLDVWDFGNDVVGDGDEEWVGEGSVDGEDGDSELDEDVTEAFVEGPGADMEQDQEEEAEEDAGGHDRSQDQDEDMLPAGSDGGGGRAATIKASKRPTGFGFQHPDSARNRLFPSTAMRSGDLELSPPSGSASASASQSQINSWSSPNPGTPRDAVSSPSPTVPPGGGEGSSGVHGVGINSRMGGLLFGGASGSTPTSGSSSHGSANTSMQGGLFFSGSTMTAGAGGDATSSPSVPASASASAGGLGIGEDAAAVSGDVPSPPGLNITPTGPTRPMIPPSLGQWSSPELGSAGGSASPAGSAYGPGPAAGPSRGLGLMGGGGGGGRVDETPSRPSRVRRK